MVYYLSDILNFINRSMVVSVFGVGAAIGGLLSAMLADKAGRRGGLFYTNIIAFLAAALMGLAKTVDVYPMMLFGRFFIGIYAGLTVIVPMYLTEVSPIKFRGTFGSLHQLLITVSILVSQLLGLPQIFGTADRWPLIFGFVAVPALLQVITLPMIPESPKFTLCIRGEVERATQDLELLRSTDKVQFEVERMLAEAVRTRDEISDMTSMLDMFRGSLLWPSTLTIVMMTAQQLTGIVSVKIIVQWSKPGINATVYYSTIIFKESGLTDKGSVYATFTMGIVNVAMTLVANILVDHHSFGRRILLLAGIVGMLVSSLLLVVSISLSRVGSAWASYCAVFFVLLFVMSFAAGPGGIPWFFPCEIFFTNARANACALGAIAHWTMSFVVAITFVFLNVGFGILFLFNSIRQFSFLMFFCFLILYFTFVWKYVPETNDLTIEEIVATIQQKQ
ncbi:MFS transporter, SP family [Dictyocaulus viviparus]|uniref:MFS transporter, SP family n=1 Tax=Dictyocaulus viviparus TaxID=29172 RepID=A0A0D8XY75_DICVI|nr:MFS transporter, SP family [Dictyocaulus viviparus]